MAFLAGFSQMDITPNRPTPLDGMGKDYERQANWVWPQASEDRLKATMVALSDGNTHVLFCCMDTLFIHELFSVPAAKAIAAEVDIPEENILFCASHTHSGVSMDEPDDSVTEHLQWLYAQLPECAKQAVADFAPATLQAGSVETVGMNAQRRYRLIDGSHRGTVYDKTYGSEDIADYETTPDRTLRSMRFVRQGKPDILLANWQMHPSYAAKNLGAVSADIYGTVRELFIQEHPDIHFAFIQGTAGNMGRLTRWEKDPGYEKCRSLDREGFGREFVRLLLDVPMEQLRTGDIQVKHDTLTVRKRVAGQVTEQWSNLPLNTVCFGDAAFATAPAEPFSDTGLQVRRNSPYKMTFVCGCCNGNYGYLPIQECFDADPENKTFEVRVSKCQPGTAELLAEKLIAMLK